MLEHQWKKDSVRIGKCEMKHVKKDNKLEVLIVKQTEIDNCSDTFVVSGQEDNISSIADLNDLEEYTQVITCVKVLNVVANLQRIVGKETQCGGGR